MSDFERDEETRRLGAVLRAAHPVVHSLEAGDYRMVITNACFRRGGNPESPLLGKLLLAFGSLQTGRTHLIRVADVRVVDGGIDAMLVEDGWVDKPVPLKVRPLTIAWGRANGFQHAMDFDDDNDKEQVDVYRGCLAPYSDPFGGL